MMLSTTDAAVEARLRRKARRLGLELTKSRTGPLVWFGRPYYIVDPYYNFILTSEWGMDLDEVAEYLADED